MENRRSLLLALLVLIAALLLLFSGIIFFVFVVTIVGGFGNGEERLKIFAFSILYAIGAVVTFGLYLFLLNFELASGKDTHLQAGNVFKNSLLRKKRLQERVFEIAKSIGSSETETFHGIVRELGIAAGKIGSSGTPALVLANLATKFPELKQSGGFLEAQKQAIAIEAAIDKERRDLNAAVSAYNALLNAFPNERFARRMGFSRLTYSEEEVSDEVIGQETMTITSAGS